MQESHGSKSAFNQAVTNGVGVVEIAQLPLDARKPWLTAARRLLWDAYPEFANAKNDKYEYFSDYFDDEHRLVPGGAYLRIAINEKGVATGLIAGGFFPDNGTASITYLVGPEARTKDALLSSARQALGRQGIHSYFIEQYKPGRGPFPLRDIEDRQTMGKLPFVERVPLKNYRQPIGTEDRGQLPDLNLYACFPGSFSPDQKRLTTISYLTKLANAYDEGLTIPENQKMLQEFSLELQKNRAAWTYNLRSGAARRVYVAPSRIPPQRDPQATFGFVETLLPFRYSRRSASWLGNNP